MKQKLVIVFNDVYGFVGIIRGENYDNQYYKYIDKNEYSNVLGITLDEILKYDSQSSNDSTFLMLKNKLSNYEIDDHIIV